MKIKINTNVTNLKEIISFESFHVLNEDRLYELVFEDPTEYNKQLNIMQKEAEFLFKIDDYEETCCDAQKGFDSFVCFFFHVKMAVLQNIRFKNDHGMISTINVKIFCKNAGWYDIPRELKIFKDAVKIPNSVSIEVLVSSFELQDILKSQNLFLVHHNSLFMLFYDENKFWLQIERKAMPKKYKVLNFLKSTNVLTKAICKLSTLYSNISEKNIKKYICDFKQKCDKNERLSREELNVMASLIQEVSGGVEYIDDFIEFLQKNFCENKYYTKNYNDGFSNFKISYNINRNMNENSLGNFKYKQNK
ncbi:hypothetical protein EHP00_941 [Ecytonucleospora hepatopenaei]|uniref:Uncharacterized protein n=1 Tax=Ecytonucleospora hepatopenaei TaxID=646526 RepID=A0A1W0E718_9MICR|nr:hypothetical protein EHP00_941 [Ecytonucleospora hepatopenaei]